MYINLKRLSLISIGTLILFASLPANAADETTTDTLSYNHVMSWTIGLLFVLCLFFACVWLVKKTGALSFSSKTNMKVISGLSLGMREKLILVQVGEKQLVLGVTPGRIDNLLVLEGSDQLCKGLKDKENADDFSNKLKQVMAGPDNE